MSVSRVVMAASVAWLTAVPAGAACSNGQFECCDAKALRAPADISDGREPVGVRVSEVIGSLARGQNGDRLGVVDDVVVDDGGRTVAVVLRTGWFLGIPTRTVVVPVRFVRFEGAEAAGAALSQRSEEDRRPKQEHGQSVLDDLMASGDRSFMRGSRSDHVEVELTRKQLLDGPPFDPM